MILTFGKYKGCSFDEIVKKDAAYLRWVLCNVTRITFTEEQRKEITRELIRQGNRKWQKWSESAYTPHNHDYYDDMDQPHDWGFN